MAQTGYTPLQIYSSSTASAAPAAGNLTNSTLGSELAINITDGKLFYKDNAGVVQVIAWKVTPATAGGTGQTSYAVGDILYADTTTSLAKLADVATGNALISGGVGVAPTYGKIGLTTHVSGTLPVANGGTGTATAFTAGSVVFAGVSGVYSENNANFFWDNTNIRLGLNNSAPTATLEIGTTASTGRYIQVNGSSTDSSYLVFKGSKQYPRIDLEDKASGGSTFQCWNLGNQLRFGTDASSQGNAAFYVAAGNAANVTFNGNLIQGTAAKGIDFSANTHAAGMTSELLNWYEEGYYTATLTPGTSGSITVNSSNDQLAYTRIGRVVHVQGFIDASSVSSPVGAIVKLNLPFNCASLNEGADYSAGSWVFTDAPSYTPNTKSLVVNPTTNIAELIIDASTVGNGDEFLFGFSYIAA